MYAPFAMLFPEESGRQRLSFSLNARNPFGLGPASYEIYDIYPALQEPRLYDIFLNVTDSDGEVQATLFCQLDAAEHAIHLSLSELHLQRPLAPALLAAVEVQFQHSRGQQWAEILLERAERMQQALVSAAPESETFDVTRLLRDEALEMLMQHADHPARQEALIDSLLTEMRQLMLAELAAHRSLRQPARGNIIPFPNSRRPDWQKSTWLELEIALDQLPEIWRHLLVPDCLTLTQLHHVLQTVLGWQDRFAWHFRQRQREFVSHAESESRWSAHNADITSLGELMPRKGSRLEYGYADCWQLEIRVRQRQRDAASLSCRTGAMAGPPEDCGGPQGFRQLQHVLLKKRRSRADKLLLAELADYDPIRFELQTLNQQLGLLETAFKVES